MREQRDRMRCNPKLSVRQSRLNLLNRIEHCSRMKVVFGFVHQDDQFRKLVGLFMDGHAELQKDLLPVGQWRDAYRISVDRGMIIKITLQRDTHKTPDKSVELLIALHR